MLVVEVLNVENRKRRSRALVVAISINISQEMRVVQCLIDSKIESNFISQILIKNAQLFETSNSTRQRIEIVDDQTICFYDQHDVDISLIDNRDVEKK